MIRDIELKTSKGVCMLKESEVNISIPGIGRNYTFVQISDLHIAVRDESDSDAGKGRAEKSEAFWRSQGCIACNKGLADEYIMSPLEANNAVAKRIRQISPDMVFLTGDIVDYTSLPNLLWARQYIKDLSCEYICVPGNHDTLNKNLSDKENEVLSELLGNTPEFCICSLKGFDIISLDDSSLKISDMQLCRMQEHIKSKRPIILLMHVPLLAPAARDPVFNKWGQNWMIGEEQQCKNNRAFLKLIEDNRDIVKAVLAGHVHIATGDDENHATGIVQYTAAPCFTGFIRIIKVSDKFE